MYQNHSDIPNDYQDFAHLLLGYFNLANPAVYCFLALYRWIKLTETVFLSFIIYNQSVCLCYIHVGVVVRWMSSRSSPRVVDITLY